jgi:hypothetical protein
LPLSDFDSYPDSPEAAYLLCKRRYMFGFFPWRYVNIVGCALSKA